MPVASFVEAIKASFSESVGDIVFGMEDGTVSIFGLVFGVAASASNSQTVLLAGATGAAAAAVSVGRPEFQVQAGVFRQREYADELVQRLRAKGYTVTLVGGPLLRVWVGPTTSRAAAERLVANLRSNGFEAMLKPVKSEAPTVEAPQTALQGAPSVEQACADFKAWFKTVEPRVRQIYSGIGCSRGAVDTYWLTMEVRGEEWIPLTHDQRLTLTKLFWEAWVNVADHEHPDKDFISIRGQAGEDRGGGGLGTLRVKGGLE